MKKTFVLIIMLSFVSFAFAQNETEDVVKRDIPIVEIQDIDGNIFSTLNIENPDGPIIIDFWATWCKPCIKELMTMNDLYEDWQDETGVKIYAISVDDSRDSQKVKPMVDGKGWEFEILKDPNGDFKRAMGVSDVPHTFIFDKNGKLISQHTSYSPGDEEGIYDELLEIIEKEEK